MAFYGPETRQDHDQDRPRVCVFTDKRIPRGLSKLGFHRRDDQPKDSSEDPGVLQRATGFTSVATSDGGTMGFPHEEGADFPDGEECPFGIMKGQTGRKQSVGF